jgi:ornithine carbamoyltransferase
LKKKNRVGTVEGLALILAVVAFGCFWGWTLPAVNMLGQDQLSISERVHQAFKEIDTVKFLIEQAKTEQDIRDLKEILVTLDGIMARTFAYQTVLDLAKYSTVPVINGLTDYDHPCQVLADLFTIYEKKGSLKGLTLTYVGDGNNVLHSLIQGCVKVGMNITYASPGGYKPLESVVEEAKETAKITGSVINATDDPVEAVKSTDVIYTDVWISMGQEEEKAKRLADLKRYQLNGELLSKAKKNVLVMHCLPAHRGEEITDEVIDGSNSIVFDEAENRLHAQKAIMKLLIA